MNSSGITKENLLFSFPVALRENDEIAALGGVTADALARRPAEISRLSIYPRIDELPEDLLDILARDFKVDWYDYDYPLKAKRELIKGSVLAHKRLGTVYAVKSVLNSLYPNSTLEEWFSYGGKPGCFRLNVNVSDSGQAGAVIVYSPEEIAARIKTVKRLSAHLENVSYMVRNAIVVGHRINSWLYRVPECGTLRCGTWWTPATLGRSERHALETGAAPDLFPVSPELAGTLPTPKTSGFSVCGVLRSGGEAIAWAGNPKEAGAAMETGVWPEQAAAGYSLRAAANIAAGERPGYTAVPPRSGEHRCGTLQNERKE